MISRWLPAAVLALSALTIEARAGDVVSESESEPFPGVKLVERIEANPSNRIFVAFVSLCTDHMHVGATAPASSRATPGSWAGAVGAQLATNGDFYEAVTPPRVYGDAVGEGIPWPLSQTGYSQSTAWYYQKNGWIAFGPDWVEFNHTQQTKTGDASRFGIGLGWMPAEVTQEKPAGTIALVSGFPELVIEGQTYTCSSPTASDCFPDRSDMRARHPRTAMGLTEDRRTFILAVVDGRDSPSSLGMYGSELAALMADLGAWEAFNLDGGGSSAMWVEGPGYVNQPSDGTPRSVANHWGVFAGAASGKPREPGSCFVPGGCFGTPLAEALAEPFQDMPAGSYAYDEAIVLRDEMITYGCRPNPPLYCPACPLPREQAAALLLRAAGIEPMAPAEPSFTDVPADDSFFPYVEEAVARGFIEPCGSDTFCPKEPTSRGELLAFVTRAAGWPLVDSATSSFEDVTNDHPLFSEMQTALERCVLDGCSDTGFCPDAPALRADAAVALVRGFELAGAHACGGQGGAGGAASTSGAGGSGNAAGIADGDDGGCGCELPGRRLPEGSGQSALAALACLLLFRRRKSTR